MRIRSNHWINRQRDMVNGVQSCELDLTVPVGIGENIMNGVRKLQVFISSMCGTTQERQKYNYVRASLKTHLEEKGFAYVYLFKTKEHRRKQPVIIT